MNQNPEPTPLRALTSASCAQRRFLCPGSAQAEWLASHAVARGEAPPDEGSAQSDEGTLLHWRDANPNADHSELPDHLVDLLERNAKLRDKFLAEVMADAGIEADEPYEDYREVELFLYNADGTLWLNPLTNEPFPGHADFIRYWPRLQVGAIQDSKFGKIPVPNAGINAQLRFYSVQLADFRECAAIYACITQPWVKGGYHSVKYTDHEESRRELLDLLARNADPSAPLSPHPEACRYCKAKAVTCRRGFDLMRIVNRVDIAVIPPEELEKLAPEVELCKQQTTAWTDRMKWIAESDPFALSEWQLGKPQEMRSVDDNEAAKARLMACGLVESDEEFLDLCKLSVVDVDKLVKEKLKGQVKSKDVKAYVEQLFGKLLQKRLKEASLVRRT